MDRECLSRRRDRHQPGARPQRRPRREPRRAGGHGAAGHDHGMATPVFVARETRPWKQVAPERRIVEEGLRPDAGQHVGLDADIGHLDRAAMDAAGQQHVSGLAAKERHGPARAHRAAHDGAARPVDAACEIDRDNRRGARVHRLDEGARRTLDRTIEAGAEQGIDDHVRLLERVRLGRLDQPLPALRGLRGIALEPAALTQQKQPRAIAALRQHPRGDKTIAAIVAGTCHDHDPAPGRVATRYGVGHRSAGGFHQINARRSGRDREPIRFGHFGGGQQFDHRHQQ